jgi:hypothetical protein
MRDDDLVLERTCAGCDTEIEQAITRYMLTVTAHGARRARRPLPGRPRVWCSNACRMRARRADLKDRKEQVW